MKFSRWTQVLESAFFWLWVPLCVLNSYLTWQHQSHPLLSISVTILALSWVYLTIVNGPHRRAKIQQRNEENFARLQKAGLYPPSGQGSDADVQRLKANGDLVFAIRLYRELHNISLKEALQAVKAIPKS